MATKTESPGVCLACKSDISRADAVRHRDTCASSGPPMLLLEVDGGGPYWLHVAADPESTFKQLDKVLRATWVECCGHLSKFEGPQGQIPMSARLSRELGPRMKVWYEYDFGSTTELELRVLASAPAPAGKAKVAVLARNRAPSWSCAACDKSAKYSCVECGCADFSAGLVCGSCARFHKCGDEMLLPLVNSPRTGVCGYTGDDEAG